MEAPTDAEYALTTSALRIAVTVVSAIIASSQAQMNSRDLRAAAGEEAIGDCITYHLGAKPPSAAWAPLEGTEF
jgi:hypothetical protein